MQVLNEPAVAVTSRWADIQAALGTGALASNGFSTITTGHGTEDLIVLFDGRPHADDTPTFDDLDIPDDLDTRRWQTRAIATRRGQRGFRRDLVTAYGAACAISGTRVDAVLEAAHISPYRGDHTNDARNGLLLRADLHTLFDLCRITVLPGRVVRVDPRIGGEYARFDDGRLRVAVERMAPDAQLLRRHNALCDWLRD